MVEQICGNCKYFENERNLCRRYPPTRTALVVTEECSRPPNYHHEEHEAITARSGFPHTDAQDWCGEWKDAARD